MSDNEQLINQGERLKKLRNHLGYTKNKMAGSVEIKAQSYGRIEHGSVGFSNAVLLKLNRLYNVSTDWLLFGVGDMFIKEELRKGDGGLLQLDTSGLVKALELLTEDNERLQEELRDLRDRVAVLEAGTQGSGILKLSDLKEMERDDAGGLDELFKRVFDRWGMHRGGESDE